MCSAANCQAMLWLLSRILLCIDTSKCMVTIALVSVSGRNVLLVHGGTFWDNAVEEGGVFICGAFGGLRLDL